jgi:hypothetical protein
MWQGPLPADPEDYQVRGARQGEEPFGLTVSEVTEWFGNAGR